jgi:polyphosphate kinase 2 (PPK2 family)
VKPVRGTDGPAAGKFARKDYEKELTTLDVELVKLQRWVQATGAKIVIVFEGRDGAGKGGTVKALTERVSPRVFSVVALPAPTRRPHLPVWRRLRRTTQKRAATPWR